MIRFENVTKVYDDGTTAVDTLARQRGLRVPMWEGA